MNKSLLMLHRFSLTLLLLLCPLAHAADAPPDLAGWWRGELLIGKAKTKLTLGWEFVPHPGGGWRGWLHSIDQGGMDIPLEGIVWQDGALETAVPAVGGTFEGKLQPDGALQGTWKQLGIEEPLTLQHVDEVPEMHRAQEPRPPLPYITKEVTFPSGGAKLSGTLTTPLGDGPHPAVVLVSDSLMGATRSANDRDGRSFGHHPLGVLSDSLTRRGFATLRFDDRGVGHSDGEASTFAQRADDVAEAVRFLHGRPEVNAKPIGLLGQGQGGWIAETVAVREPNVAFLVVMGTPGVSSFELLTAQMMALAKGDKNREVLLVEQLSDIVNIIQSEDDPAKREAQLRSILTALIQSFIAPGGGQLNAMQQKVLDTEVARQISVMQTPWFRDFIAYQPGETLQKLRCPVLALFGQHDLLGLLDASLNAAATSEALKDNPRALVQEIPGVNSLFQTQPEAQPDARKALIAAAKNPETIAPDVLKLVGDWIAEKPKQ